MIDFGANLPGSNKEEYNKKEIEEITNNADAIIYTHFHGDHIGLHHLIPSEIKQYIGKGAKEVMLCKYEALKKHGDYSANIESANKMLTYSAIERVDINNKGEIFVTPYFVSHSAFDAYMLKIECEGKIILHTGDFRKHGYLGKGLMPTLKNYIGKVDVLITEGTMLSRESDKVIHESEIKSNVKQLLKDNKYVFALCSSTDIDRLASFHAACKETGRLFVADEYQCAVLDVFSQYLKAGKDLYYFKPFKLVNYSTKNVVWKLKKEGFLMPIRTSYYKIIKEMLEIYNDEKPLLIYSMWRGYAIKGRNYTSEDVIKIRELFEGRIADGTKDGVHSSGHADIETLKEVCQKVSPRVGIIPIHKDENDKLETLFNTEKYEIFNKGEYSRDNITIIVK